MPWGKVRRLPYLRSPTTGASGVGQLHPDLVLAAGEQLDFEQRVSLHEFERAVVQLGPLSIGGSRGGDVHLAVPFVLAQVVDQRAGGRFDAAFDECPVSFFERRARGTIR